MQRFHSIFPALLLGLFYHANTFAETIRYFPKKRELKYTYATVEPVLRLKPGDILETWTERADNNTLQKPGDWLPTGNRPNPNTGPFHIENSAPGDTLAVHVIEIEPAQEVAVGYAGAGFGALTGTRYTQMLDQPIENRVWFYRIDREKRTVEYRANDSDFRVALPLRPFLGCLAVAPRADEARQTIVPEFFGGNLDTPEVRGGTTVYLPVNVEGALLYLGDGHAVQGEGEIAGTAAEVQMNVRLKVDVIKGKSIGTIRLEDAEYLMAAGSYRPLEDAMRIASREMVEWLHEDFGLSRLDAYQLLSVAMESNVSQLVDPNYTVLVKIRKNYLN